MEDGGSGRRFRSEVASERKLSLLDRECSHFGEDFAEAKLSCRITENQMASSLNPDHP